MGLEWFRDVRPFAGMVMVILAQVSNMVVMKAAMSQGMDKYVIIAYSNGLASLVFFLYFIIFHRSASSRPPVTFNIFCGFLLISVLGTLGQICGYAGIQYSSPNLGMVVLNIVPALTFVLAIIFRMERIHWRSSSSQAKVVGTIASIGGAFVATIYKGPPMIKTNTSYPLLVSQRSNWIFGGLLLSAEAMTFSASHVTKALVLKKFKAPLLMSCYTFSLGTILSSIYCVIVVKDSSAWKLKLDMGLVVILYSAIVSMVMVGLIAWCLWKTGPLFVSVFKPLGIIFSVIMSVVFLGDVLCLGSFIGAVIIVIGFYAVMWGKAKEDTEMVNGEESSESSSNKVPLLQNKIEEI